MLRSHLALQNTAGAAEANAQTCIATTKGRWPNPRHVSTPIMKLFALNPAHAIESTGIFGFWLRGPQDSSRII
jgi:hypothetical protein